MGRWAPPSTSQRSRMSTAAAAGEEGLRLLRQQLSAVQRIRVEHERKDATIAALRLEVRKRGCVSERPSDWAGL